MNVIDCHAHFYAPSNYGKQEIASYAASMNSAQEEDGFVLAAVVVTPETWDDCLTVLAQSAQHPLLKPCAGLHPVQPGGMSLHPRQVDSHQLKNLIGSSSSPVVAIGEIGLDFSPWILQKTVDASDWWRECDVGDCGVESVKQLQKEAFRTQVLLAKELNLPVNVHSRNAGHHAISLLEECEMLHRALLHAFDGATKHAVKAAEKGAVFSIPGSVVREASFRKLVVALPLSSLCLESDAPALAPVKNTKSWPKDSCMQACVAIAELKGITAMEVARVTTENATRLFGLALTAATPSKPLSNLPPEIVSYLARRHLHHADILTLMQCSRNLHTLLATSQALWAAMTLQKTNIAYIEDGGDWKRAYFNNNLLEACPHLSALVNVHTGFSSAEGLKGLAKVVQKLFKRTQFERIACMEEGCEIDGPANIWMCLTKGCNRVGCGRKFNKHALQHYEAEGADHSLFVRLGTFQLWCNECGLWLDTLDAPAVERKFVQTIEACLLSAIQSVNPHGESCIRSAMALNARRALERAALDIHPNDVAHFVSVQFARQWHGFVVHEDEDPPALVDNDDLLVTDEEGVKWLRSDVFPNQHFSLFSQRGWELLQRQYPGSGPTVTEHNIYPGNVSKRALVDFVKMRAVEEHENTRRKRRQAR
ncbi:hypothetical protein BC830DRAFT_486170 [Chytriomyces sp. MP71]|nr:hypothetical protein BC830DRAFT_486170 [Chytriomyces sp. MP71]